MTEHDDHGTLPTHAERLLARLEGIERLTVHGGTAHMQHMVDRVLGQVAHQDQEQANDPHAGEDEAFHGSAGQA